MSENENQVVAERAIRQAFLQLSHLGNVWRDVLPANIYAKSMGMYLTKHQHTGWKCSS